MVYLDTVQNIFENTSIAAVFSLSVLWCTDLRIFSKISVRKPVIICTLLCIIACNRCIGCYFFLQLTR
jgi:hypothetical protein